MADKTAEQVAIEAKLKDKGLPTDGESNEETVEEGQEGSEEVVVEVEEEGAEEVEIQEEAQEPAHSENELQAMQSGWMPLDEWEAAGNDPDEWVSAKQFNRNGEYLRKIHNQTRQIKKLDDVVTTLAKQQKKIFDAGYSKAKRDLKSQLREAIKEGDDATADHIEERLEALETQRVEDSKTLEVTETPDVKDTKQEVAPEFASWVDRNQWFVKHPEMRAYGEVVGLQYAQKNPEKSNVEVYQYVTETVKKKFPEKFGATMKKVVKKQGSPVEGSDGLNGGNQRSSNGPVVKVSLTAEEKQVGRTLIARGLYKNLNEYATELKKLGVKG
jgi:hypothetical protein